MSARPELERAPRESPRRPPRPVREPQVSTGEFELLRRLIYRESGIHLPDSKRELLNRRLARRLCELSLETFSDYYHLVTAPGAGDELVTMLDCITTNETRFFREPRHFELLEEKIIPRWLEAAQAGERARRVRVWSAACSTGQEAYSVAIVLLQHLTPAAGWKVEVLATDLSTEALEVASAAIWPIDQMADIPERFLKKFMLRGKAARLGWIKASPGLRAVVDCRRMNLHEPSYPGLGAFDLILCRNVLIYFDHAARVAVVERLLEHLNPDGYLFGGHAESLTSLTPRLRAVVPTVYRRISASGGRV